LSSDFNVDYSKLGKVENGDMIALGSDAEYHAEFHLARVPNFDGTAFEEVVHLRLQAPGNTKTVYDQPVRLESYPGRPSDPERFPQAWADYQSGQSTATGTSIYDWDGCTKADAQRFDLAGIKTVEQLAKVSDVNLTQLGMGALALRTQARAFINGNSTETELLGRVQKLTEIVNALLAEREAPKGRKEKTPVSSGS
jgi:hypothetical protein